MSEQEYYAVEENRQPAPNTGAVVRNTPSEPAVATQGHETATPVPEDTPDPDEGRVRRYAARAEAAEAEVERLTRECLDRDNTETDARERLRRVGRDALLDAAEVLRQEDRECQADGNCHEADALLLEIRAAALEDQL